MERKPKDYSWVKDLELPELNLLLRIATEARQAKVEAKRQRALSIIQEQQGVLRNVLPLARNQKTRN
jgi:hypothetical protein